ncbi:MAG: hypothetical protein ACREN6_01360 [Gemmatimonadaceae bacterium]
MRSSRLVVLSLATAAAVGFTPAAGHAQSASRPFADSWYWGVFGGVTNFATTPGSGNLHTTAPTVGIDWMLTREKFALNIFANQSYFSTTSSVADVNGSGPLPVGINDMRQVGFSLMLFTPEIKMIKPYVSLGYSFNFVNSAKLGTCAACTTAAADSNATAIVDARAMGRVFANVGAMWVYKRWAPFAQVSLMPTQGASDWYINGTGFTTSFAAGIRYNFGSSIDKSW